MTSSTAAQSGQSLEERAVEVVEAARRCVDFPVDEEFEETADLAGVAKVLDDAQFALQSALSDPVCPPSGEVTSLALLLVDLVVVRDEVLGFQRERRRDALDAVQHALGHLRGLPTAAAVMDTAVRELCTTCGMSRALLFRVDGSEMVLESSHFRVGVHLAEDIRQVAKVERPQLNHLLLETEMIRRRRPLLVTDPQTSELTFRPLMSATMTEAYVAAPIMPQGAIIGFLHADRYGQDRRCDELDRDALWTFAEGFGFALERATLMERLRRQRTEIHRLMSSTAAMLDDFCESEVNLSRTDDEAASVARSAAGLFIAPENRIASLLTRREMEVLALLADGATNAAIAARLVISESTVKSHVKHVMRKLRASNRAEAVSRYHKIANASSGPC